MLETPADEAAARRRLEELQTLHGMPAESAMQEVFLQRVRVGELDLSMVGLIAKTPAGASVTGSAADEVGFPVDRAFFELVERVSIVVARASTSLLSVRDRSGVTKAERTASQVFPADKQPDRQRASLSNGVALHTSWPLACDAAQGELIERDRVLRSFAGEYAPTPWPDAVPSLERALSEDYDVSAYTFGPQRPALAYVATGMFLFPRRESAPLVYGFGAATAAGAALESAKREALQRLAFLWGEELPTAAPAEAPTPDYHQEFYLYPPHQAILRDWLAGKHQPALSTKTTPTNSVFDRATSFVDLTIKGLTGGLVVAKALGRNAARLRFGVSGVDGRAKIPPHPIA